MGRTGLRHSGDPRFLHVGDLEEGLRSGRPQAVPEDQNSMNAAAQAADRAAGRLQAVRMNPRCASIVAAGAALCLAMAFAATNLHGPARSEEHTSELQSLMRTSYAVFCLKK